MKLGERHALHRSERSCPRAPLRRLARIVASALLATAASVTGVHADPGNALGLPTRPNIVLVTVDTLRADHLGAYGYERPTTPVIDALAKRGVRYANAVSQAPWTLPSLASILTGLYPTEHGATHAELAVNDAIQTVAESLRAAGYRTIGVVGHDFAGEKHGLSQGFDFFDESVVPEGHGSATSRRIVEIALGALKERSEGPFFLWIHLFDPHFNWVRHPEYGFATEYLPALLPGTPRETITVDFLGGFGRNPKNRALMTPAFKDFVRAVYDEEIANTDHRIGELLDEIAALGHADDTVTVLTADHGEFFWERDRMFHEGEVYRELVHVPLIVSGPVAPPFRGHVVLREVELSSLAGTLASIAGIADHGFAGENLAGLAAKAEEPRLALSEGSWAGRRNGRTRAAVYGGWKLIERLDDQRHELYHTSVDPAETLDLWPSHRPDVVEMRAFLVAALERFAAERRPVAPPVDADIDPHERERLRALGYVE